MNLSQIVSEQIRMRRLMLRFSQAELSKKAKVSQATIAQIEIGRKLPSLRTLDKIARTLKVHPSLLLMDCEWEIK